MAAEVGVGVAEGVQVAGAAWRLTRPGGGICRGIAGARHLWALGGVHRRVAGRLERPA